MTTNAKRNPVSMAIASIVVLIGHYIDYYLIIMPGAVGENARIGLF